MYKRQASPTFCKTSNFRAARSETAARTSPALSLIHISKHIENAAVPCLRGRTNVRSDFAHLGVHVVEQAGEVARDAIYQNAFYPFLDDLTNQAKIDVYKRQVKRCSIMY